MTIKFHKNILRIFNHHILQYFIKCNASAAIQVAAKAAAAAKTSAAAAAKARAGAAAAVAAALGSLAAANAAVNAVAISVSAAQPTKGQQSSLLQEQEDLQQWQPLPLPPPQQAQPAQ